MPLPRRVLLVVLGLTAGFAILLAGLGLLGRGAGAQPVAPTPPRAATSVAASATRPTAPARPALPRPVARALRRRQAIVLFFGQGRGADDAATRRAVSDVQRRFPRVAVVADSVGRLGRYRPVVGALQIGQAPAVVIVRPDRTARLLEGYVDRRSLAQHVVDVLR